MLNVYYINILQKYCTFNNYVCTIGTMNFNEQNDISENMTENFVHIQIFVLIILCSQARFC